MAGNNSLIIFNNIFFHYVSFGKIFERCMVNKIYHFHLGGK